MNWPTRVAAISAALAECVVFLFMLVGTLLYVLFPKVVKAIDSNPFDHQLGSPA